MKRIAIHVPHTPVEIHYGAKDGDNSGGERALCRHQANIGHLQIH